LRGHIHARHRLPARDLIGSPVRSVLRVARVDPHQQREDAEHCDEEAEQHCDDGCERVGAGLSWTAKRRGWRGV